MKTPGQPFDRVEEVLPDKPLAATQGEIKTVKVTDKRLFTEIRVQTGNGGSGTMAGDGSTMGGINVKAANGVLDLIGGDGGDGQGMGGIGGVGGIIGTTKATVGTFRAIAGDGGDAANGAGGAGGEASGLTITAKINAQQIRGGAGGNGLTAGGAGGDVSGVKVKGDIGDFLRPFGIRPFQANPEFDMGGLFAGTGGTGTVPGIAGSISNVSANRIAAILAVNDGTDAVNLNVNNAVTAISGLKTKVIGADIDGDGTFDFVDNGVAGFALGGGDEAIDGLVIVKSAGVPAGGLKPTPLMIITV
jgi:hypothetical protein